MSQTVKEKEEIQDSIQETIAKSEIETDFEESVYCASVVEESVSRSDNGLEEYTLSLELPTDKVTDFTFGEDDIAGGELEEFLEPFGFSIIDVGGLEGCKIPVTYVDSNWYIIKGTPTQLLEYEDSDHLTKVSNTLYYTVNKHRAPASHDDIDMVFTFILGCMLTCSLAPIYLTAPAVSAISGGTFMIIGLFFIPFLLTPIARWNAVDCFKLEQLTK